MDYNKYYYSNFSGITDKNMYNLNIKSSDYKKSCGKYLNTAYELYNWFFTNTLNEKVSCLDPGSIRGNHGITKSIEDSKFYYNNSIEDSYAMSSILGIIKNAYEIKEKIFARMFTKPVPRKENKKIYWVSQFSLRGDTINHWLLNNNRIISTGYSKPVPVILNKNNQLEIALDKQETKNGTDIFYPGKEITSDYTPSGTIYRPTPDWTYEYLKIDSEDTICKSYFDNNVDVFDNYEDAFENLREKILTEFERLENHYAELLEELDSLKYQGTQKPSKLLKLIELNN
jgi:hypothetical protein